jgi:integrase
VISTIVEEGIWPNESKRNKIPIGSSDWSSASLQRWTQKNSEGVYRLRGTLKFALPTMYGTLFAVAITTGMRPSEYIGLKWQDIEWERGTVSVKRTLRKGPTGQWEYGETKRAGSRRLIRLQNWVIARLKGLKEFQAAHSVVDPEEWPESVDLIFVTEFGRPVNVNSLVYKHFKPILKRAGLPNIRLYDLRHTAATLALTVGVSPKIVSEQLGHTSAAFTLDVYSHVLPHMQDDAVAKVEAALMGQ